MIRLRGDESAFLLVKRDGSKYDSYVHYIVHAISIQIVLIQQVILLRYHLYVTVNNREQVQDFITG